MSDKMFIESLESRTFLSAAPHVAVRVAPLGAHAATIVKPQAAAESEPAPGAGDNPANDTDALQEGPGNTTNGGPDGEQADDGPEDATPTTGAAVAPVASAAAKPKTLRATATATASDVRGTYTGTFAQTKPTTTSGPLVIQVTSQTKKKIAGTLVFNGVTSTFTGTITPAGAVILHFSTTGLKGTVTGVLDTATHTLSGNVKAVQNKHPVSGTFSAK